MKEAVLGSSMVFQEVDYMEAVRYLALNWDAETCRRSHLRRILPTRRGRRGNRPGVKGPGPRGKVKGDQEQWLFPTVVLTEKEKREVIAEVVALATKAMFNHHYYRFGGKTFHQVQGGPIGLRGTCAVARIVMQLFDAKWKRRLQELGITTWLISRYVDDSRAILQPIRPGWRWVDNDLRYTKKWEQEDKDIPGEIRTRDILVETMTGIESYLAFTAETESDFQDGWLPTLDTSWKVGDRNQVLYRHFEKETATNQTIQKSSAMGENVKVQIVAQDLVRRLSNTMEALGSKEKARVVDEYAQKLLNSGYEEYQVRRIIVSGIKGFEGKKLRHERQGWRLRRTAAESGDTRAKKKLLAKTNWYKKKKTENLYDKSKGGSRMRKGVNNYVEHKTVLFVEQTNNGELGRRLRELMERISPILGFGVKIVERNGASLKSKFPQASLWEGAHCGRAKCITCNQGAEYITPCSRKSVVYENICAHCNQGAGAKEEIRDLDERIPSLYIGETSRTIQERGLEHWAAYRGNKKSKEGSHIYKHQELQHGGEEPKFMMRAISFHRSALSRQTAEAVRIRRRGGMGALLNSKSEFNRCYIPRLTVVEEDIAKEMEQEEIEAAKRVEEDLRNKDQSWERSKAAARPSKVWNKGSRGKHGAGSSKGQRPSKRRKFELLTNWGEEIS